ncbi:hypothetical protein CRE_06666 [Caenorhabditis remanei]|uniref:Domain of unknown function WSN domain-containing protein n=1 Tax=Caenorhabditis remanei TaxID=31234 RepID=E3M0T7_CAERE|nr:hypothetical protein CRE_06666 [Caenorhabditis remanei]
MLIFFFFISFSLLFSLTHQNVPPPEPTDLELVTEDFLTLARITNAIFLQASLIRKNLDTRETIAELLKIDQTDLLGILNIDTQSALSKVEELKKKSSNIWKARMTPDSNFGEIISDLKRVWYVLKYIRVSPLIANISTDELNAAVISVAENISEFSNACKIAELRSLRSRTYKYSEQSLDVDEDDASEDLRKFGKYLKCFKKCFDFVNSFSKSLQDASFWDIYKMYELTYKASRMFFETNSLNKYIPKLINDLAITKELREYWKNSGNSGSEILKSLGSYEDHDSKLEPTPPVLTVAFRTPEEMLQINKDLENPWFQKHFIRGSKAIDNLKKSLEPLRPISESVQNLSKLWESFDVLMKSGPAKLRVKKVASILTTLELMVKNQSLLTHDDFLATSSKILIDCTIKPDDGFTRLQKNFEKHEKPLKKVREELRNLQDRFDLFGKTINTRKANFDIIDSCLNALEITVQSSRKGSTKKMTALQNAIRSFSNCTASRQMTLKLIDLIAIFREYLDSFNNFETAYTKFQIEMNRRETLSNSGEIVQFSEVLEKSKVNETLNCLMLKNFEPEKLMQSITFARTFSDFPNQEKLDTAKTFLETLQNIQASLKTVENNFNLTGNRTKRAAVPSNPVLTLNNSRFHSEDMGICAIALSNMVDVQAKRGDLLKIKKFTGRVGEKIDSGGVVLKNFKNPEASIRTLLEQVDEVNEMAKKLRNKVPSKEAEIFNTVAGIDGIIGNREILWKMWKENKGKQEFINAEKKINTLISLNLDFQTYQSRLLDGRFTVITLKKYFDEIFGHVKKSNPNEKTKVVVEKHTPIVLIILIVVGVLLLLIIGVIVIYGLSKKGREKYKNLYLFYFGKPDEFEKRWRYSVRGLQDGAHLSSDLQSFMDKVNGENALLSSIHEINKTNMLIALKRGVYINAYNKFGNTALHSATKGGHPELVDALIRHGADRTLLNVENRTPEQMIPFKFQILYPERAERYEQIQNIYKKYQKKKYKIRVPEVFPLTSYRIWIEDRTDDKLTNQFMDVFQSIHQGVLYDTVLQWSEAMAKGDVPYLYGVQVAIAMKACSNIVTLSALITNHGGILLDQFPDKSNYNSGSHPYMHSHLGPLFVLHDGETDLSKFKNDKMFTLFTEDEFIAFMLRRDIKKDSSENPICVLREQE